MRTDDGVPIQGSVVINHPISASQLRLKKTAVIGIHGKLEEIDVGGMIEAALRAAINAVATKINVIPLFQEPNHRLPLDQLESHLRQSGIKDGLTEFFASINKTRIEHLRRESQKLFEETEKRTDELAAKLGISMPKEEISLPPLPPFGKTIMGRM